MKNKLLKKTMKNAYIENVMMWIVIFTSFVWMFFFVIDYASIVRVNDNMNAMADYSANRIAREGSSIRSDANFLQNLNDMSVKTVANIEEDDIVCSTDENGAFQVIFEVETTNNDYKFYDAGKLISKRVVFNDTGTSDTISCKLTITLSQ